MRKLLSHREVAEAMGVSSDWLYRHKRILETRGFPRPVPVIGRYDPLAIQRWQDAQIGTPVAPVPPASPPVAAAAPETTRPDDDFDAELDARAAAIASGTVVAFPR